MTIKTTVNLRRISQVLFFLIFFWLILKTNFEVNFTPNDTSQIVLPYPVSIALEFSPLTALGTLLSEGTIYKGLLWALVILIPTIFLGRFFCGWICPLGTLNHWLSEFRSERLSRRGLKRIKSNRYHKYQRIKYYIFFILIASAFAGTLLTGIFDPLSFLARSIGTVALPVLHESADGVLEYIGKLGIPPVTSAAQFIYDAVSPVLLTFRKAHFHTILTIGFFFLAVLVMNRIFSRFWCRGICPLGAMLGIFSRFAVFGLEKKESACDSCMKCAMHCQGADGPEVGEKWRQSECVMCLNCQDSCPQNALSFKFFPNYKQSKENPDSTQKIDITRRKAVASVAGGLALFPLFRASDGFNVNPDPKVIRPPGAVAEESFLGRCIRCGQCMRVCPNNALHPTLFEAGLEGIWSPIMIPRIGYCEPTCTLCGQVCPTGAILEMTVAEKVGDKKNPPNRVGTAFVNHSRCLPWAMARPCIVCEEWCPTTPKAIYLEEEVVINAEGREVEVKKPVVAPDRCTGCGACEYACPVIDEPAIHITSIGESRSGENQILLQRDSNKN